MHSSLVIHNDNISNIDSFEDSIKFTPTYNDIDKYISSDIIENLKNKKFDVLYIKDNLSANYLELYGLRVAYHIRLSAKLEDARYVPIVIISDISSYALNKISSLSNILFTKNIFIVKNNKQSIEAFNNINLKNLTRNEYQNKFLNLIKVNPPKDYLSHHSIANEWSIYKWSNFIHADSTTIQLNNDKISSMLYFKYLVSLYPTEKGGLKIIKKGEISLEEREKPLQKVLYIDDEFNNGWEDIFKTFFAKNHNQKFQFSTIKEIKKDTTYKELKNYMIEYIKNDTPDLIILDIRLVNEDHENIGETDLSGIKLLKYIKEEINSGIQVILLTASGKSKILNEANKYDILGYLKKEHPQDTISNTKETFDKLKKLIDYGFERQYLKDIWNIQREILKLEIFNADKYNEIKLEILSIFEVLNSKMRNQFIYSMFSIFKVLESLVKFYIEEKKDSEGRYAYWINSNEKIPFIKYDNSLIKTELGKSNDTATNKIRVILHERLNIKDKNIHNTIIRIADIRNNTIHPKTTNNNYEVNKNDILEWFGILEVILKNSKI